MPKRPAKKSVTKRVAAAPVAETSDAPAVTTPVPVTPAASQIPDDVAPATIQTLELPRKPRYEKVEIPLVIQTVCPACGSNHWHKRCPNC